MRKCPPSSCWDRGWEGAWCLSSFRCASLASRHPDESDDDEDRHQAPTSTPPCPLLSRVGFFMRPPWKPRERPCPSASFSCLSPCVWVWEPWLSCAWVGE